MKYKHIVFDIDGTTQKSRRHSYMEHLRDWYFVIFYIFTLLQS